MFLSNEQSAALSGQVARLFVLIAADLPTQNVRLVTAPYAMSVAGVNYLPAADVLDVDPIMGRSDSLGHQLTARVDKETILGDQFRNQTFQRTPLWLDLLILDEAAKPIGEPVPLFLGELSTASRTPAYVTIKADSAFVRHAQAPAQVHSAGDQRRQFPEDAFFDWLGAVHTVRWGGAIIIRPGGTGGSYGATTPRPRGRDGVTGGVT